MITRGVVLGCLVGVSAAGPRNFFLCELCVSSAAPEWDASTGAESEKMDL